MLSSTCTAHARAHLWQMDGHFPGVAVAIDATFREERADAGD